MEYESSCYEFHPQLITYNHAYMHLKLEQNHLPTHTKKWMKKVAKIKGFYNQQ
jgi:hypothetical protein